MNIYRINTTAFEEEDFLLATSLSKEDVVKTIAPIVIAERNGMKEYTNDELINAIAIRYPKHTVLAFTNSNIERICI
jgi:hypothetical protein